MKQIVIINGINGGGKTTVVQSFVRDGFYRINRDTTGGKLDGQAILAEAAFGKGIEKIVLDNTYCTEQSRKSIIALAKKVGANISCRWLSTSFEDAQLNASIRMVRTVGRLLSPEEMKKTKNPNLFPPIALFAFRNNFQMPTTAEGFDEVIEIPFIRVWPSEYKNKAVIFDYDGTLRDSLGKEEYPTKISEIRVKKVMSPIIKKFENEGYIILGASNQSGIAKGTLSEKDAIDCFEETNRQLGVKVEFAYCPHRIPPVTCYCRKPSPGLGAFFIEKFKLNPAETIMIGDQTSDKTFAERCGFKFTDVAEICGA